MTLTSVRVLMCAATLTFFCLSCSRTAFLYPQDYDVGASTWGDFAATLDVPDCPSSNPVLTVNTTADELDGGQSITDPSQAGDYLSFAEAIWIAANRGTPHNIFFDAEVFPVATPGVIHVRDHPEMPSAGSGLCINGRRRGVVVAYDESSPVLADCASTSWCRIPLNRGLLVGLTFENLPAALIVNFSQLAGCHLTDAPAIDAYYDVLIGPGNVFGASNVAVYLSSVYSGGEIVGNYFGYDPLTRKLLDLGAGVITSRPIELRENVFGKVASPANASPVAGTHAVVLRDNYFGVDEHGSALPMGALGFTAGGYGSPLKIGPSNVFRGLDGVAVTGESGMRVTRNVISGNGGGIVYNSGAPVTAPVVTSVTGTAVSGTCAVAGTIEVFSDPGDQGETFLGEALCDAVSPWSLAVQVPRGRNVTATLTDASGSTSEFSLPLAAP